MARLFGTLLTAIAVMVTSGGTAHADPTPPPTPGYQIPGPDGPQFPGAQIYPPVRARYMPACGFTYDPDAQTWQPRGDE